MDKRPIGIFDSGVGGLTVAKEVMKYLHNEDIIYFGDTARVPYGSKSKNTIIKFSKQITRFLLTQEVKAIVIACGTASTMALTELQKEFDIPIIGVAEPGSKAAAEVTKNNKIGIIGTEGTINSELYTKLIKLHNKAIEIYGQACPLFVPLVEEGWINDSVTIEVTKRYLHDLLEKDIDTLVLACTHYPLLIDVISQFTGEGIKLVNPAYETAKALAILLTEKRLNNDNGPANYRFFVSDRVDKFENLAKQILKSPMLPVKQVNIEDY